MHTFAFESYGVRISVSSNSKREIVRARKVAATALVANLREALPEDADFSFHIKSATTELRLFLDGEDLGENSYRRGFYHYFGSRLKLTVAENAANHIFVHAGVIGWNGKAVLFPADSHQGKSTLTAALIKRGAVYYSDDYAAIDKDGLVHPFARRLSIRHRSEPGKWREVSPKTMGATVGVDPLRIGLVIITKFDPDGRWKPEILTPGIGLLEIIPFTIPLKVNPETALSVLKCVTTRAIIARSSRNDVELCVNDILDFVDKTLL